MVKKNNNNKTKKELHGEKSPDAFNLSEKFEERIEEWKNINLNSPLQMTGKDIATEIEGNIMRDVKEFIKKRINESTKLLALFNQGKLTSINLREHRQNIKDDAGDKLK